MKIFGLMAFGNSELDGQRTQIPSLRMHPTRESAEADLPNFTQLVTQPHEKNLDCLELSGLEIEVFEYELITEES